MQRVLRYGVVGVLNTLLGYGVILGGLSLGLGDYPSNILGYSVGLTFSFFVNRSWTFGMTGAIAKREVSGFGIAFMLAYAANLLVLSLSRAAGLVDSPLAHLAAMAVYSGMFFLITNYWVFAGQGKAVPFIRECLARYGPEMALCLLAVSTLHVIGGIAVSHDVTWQFWIARQMLGGAQLYRDIWEVNPPLWFWSAIPIEYAAQSLQIAPSRILSVIIVGMGAGSALLIGHLGEIEQPIRRTAIMALAFWFCVPMPLFDFGQREQLVIICALPYATLIARRADGRAVSVGMALLVGFFAAYGFALKHYFLLTPVLLEMWLALRLRWQWNLVRPELLVLGGAGLTYAAAIVVFAPDFLSFIVPMVRSAYAGYNVPLLLQLDEAAQLIWALSAIALAGLGGVFGRQASTMVSAMTLVAIAFIASYFLQQKGWQYHAIPATAAILLAVTIRLSELRPREFYRHPLAIATIAFAIFMGLAYGPYHDFLRKGSQPLLATVEKGEPVVALAADPMWIWPIAEEDGLAWPLHVYSFWMLPAIGHAEILGPYDPALEKLGNLVRRQTLADILCHPPALILGERRRRYEIQPEQFDMTSFFLRDSAFRTFMTTHYIEEAPTRYLRVFRRRGRVAPSSSSSCRSIAPLNHPITSNPI
jgi:putative flippase GtrA